MSSSFRISKAVFQGLLVKVAPIIPSSAATPIIQCVEIVGEPGSLVISATKLDNSIRVKTLDFQTLDTFRMVFPFKRLRDIVSKADVGDIDIMIGEGSATIVSGAASWEVQFPSGETFPKIPTGSTYQAVDGHDFKAAFEVARKSASQDVTRPSLRMIHVDKGRMTACDGIKFTQLPMAEDFPLDLTVDIPSGSAELVMHFLKEVGEVGIGQSSSHVFIKNDENELVINKPTSSYPNVEQIMLRPALENKTALTLDREELLRAIARVRINADPETEAVGLAVSAKSVVVSSKDMTGNGATETIAADWVAKDRTLVVNCNLMTQLLGNFSSSTCSIMLGEDSKSRKSVVLIRDEEGKVSLIPQMSGNIRTF